MKPIAVYDNCKNRLGNLAFLENLIKIAIGNDFYIAKQNGYCKSNSHLARGMLELTNVGQTEHAHLRINEKFAVFSACDATSAEKRYDMLIVLSREV